MTTTHTPGLGDAAPCNASLIAAAPDLLNVLEESGDFVTRSRPSRARISLYLLLRGPYEDI